EQSVAQLINELYTKFPNYDINTFVNPYLKLTLLHINAQYGRSNIIQGLLEQNPIIDIRDINQRTPLHYAAMSGNIECLKSLIKKGANINAQTSVFYLYLFQFQYINKKGNETPLMKAAQFNQQNTLFYLLQNKADTSIKNFLQQSVSDILRIQNPNLYQITKQNFPQQIN
ncbi:hypothetical protein IMG5_196620, partial [Ichthyophthirius multifiliis]